MGNQNACCGPNYQELDLKLNPGDNLYEARFFHLYPKAKELISTFVLPTNFKSISKSKMTYFKEEGIYLGKECKVRHGIGIMIYEPEGLYYVGSWNNNVRQGLGIMFYQDGSYYKGEWYQDQPHGYGFYFSSDSKWKYEGKWKAGVKEGQGMQTYPDGTVFTGNYHEGLKQGAGVITFKAECVYDDREKQNSNMEGTAVVEKMKCSFKGSFKNDKANGYGVQRGENYKYEGQWVDNQMHGAGKSTYYNQQGVAIEFYIGEFKNGQKEGYGEYRWADGRIYKGQWVAGEMVSKGVFIDKRD